MFHVLEKMTFYLLLFSSFFLEQRRRTARHFIKVEEHISNTR
jgi:hypothetical protein